MPQKIGAIEYVGSPFHVHFGDKFKPRCILIKNAYDNHDLHFQTISRVTVKASGMDALRNENLRAGDQVKLRMELSEGEKHDWHKIKREALQYLAAQGVAVHGVELLVKPSVRRVVLGDVEQHSGVKKTPYDEVVRFVDAESLSGDVLTVGLELI